MTKKELYIISRFGSLWETLNESAKKCALKNNGWVASIVEHRPQDVDTDFCMDKMGWRLKSLNGIENDNNGWFIISEELPDESTVLWYNNENGDYYLGTMLDEDFDILGYTHWCKINPKGPIY